MFAVSLKNVFRFKFLKVVLHTITIILCNSEKPLATAVVFDRSSRSEVFLQNVAFENFEKFTGKQVY